jgi:hypothetical protein
MELSKEDWMKHKAKLGLHRCHIPTRSCISHGFGPVMVLLAEAIKAREIKKMNRPECPGPPRGILFAVS